MDYLNHLFFGLKGRIPRRDFWVGAITILVLEIVLAAYLEQVFNVPVEELSGPNLTDARLLEIYDQLVEIGLLINVIFLWPWISVIGKRCHDRNKSGWWVLLAYVPVIGSLWTFIELGLVRGTRGPNRFGPESRTRP